MRRMAPLRPLSVLAVLALAAGCYQQDATVYSTFPEPAQVSGPPGGEIDPAWQQLQYAGDPDGDPAGYGPATEDVAAMQTDVPSSDPQAAGYMMGATNDVEIDTTLDSYGEWIEMEGYGRVWRPYTSAVGLDFTPYESCGTWVWTDDSGWTFACDWDWGWLAFHYGRWGWFEDYWAWQPGYEWSPGAVEWRTGEDVCGWRPLAPTQSSGYWDNGHWVDTGHDGGASGGGGGWQIRDHRDHPGGWSVPTDTKIPALADSHWRFSKRDDFGKRIKPNVLRTPAEGLRVTRLATKLPMTGNTRAVAAASIMRSRLEVREKMRTMRSSNRETSPAPRAPTGFERQPSSAAIQRMWPRERSVERDPAPTWQPSLQPGATTTPVRTHGGAPRDVAPSSQPRDWTPPSRPIPTSHATEQWVPPARDYSPPSRTSAPTKSDWSPPSRESSKHDDTPSRGSSAANWSPPSHSSSSSSSPSWGGGSSHSIPSRSGGGGVSPGGFSGGGRRR